MSAAFPYTMLEFPEPLNQFNSAIMLVDVTVTNPADSTKTLNLEMQFDTGASISLGPRSVATLLDLNWDAGVPLQLEGVGGAVFSTQVHVLKAVLPPPPTIMANGDGEITRRPLLFFRALLNQYEQSVVFDLPIAIAEGEDFDLLLGMLGVMDDVGEFLCDNINRTLWLKEYLTKGYVFPSVVDLRQRLRSRRLL